MFASFMQAHDYLFKLELAEKNLVIMIRKVNYLGASIHEEIQNDSRPSATTTEARRR